MPTDKLDAQLTPRIFFNKVLAGTASGTIIALIPNAVLGAILKYFAEYKIIEMIIHAAQIFQLATPLIIGGLIAFQFGLTPQKMMIAGGAAFAGSGVIKFNSEVKGFIGAGTGDIINIMITASVAVLLLLVIDKKFGSVEIIALPIVVGVGAGLFGMLIYPYVTQITVAIGKVINNFTDFQPIIMSILIACSFAALIISPITTVAIGLAIQLNGLSWNVNQSGVTLAVSLGGMKMMMPNLFKYPIILIPCLFTATISAIPVVLFNISGTPQSAGFGLVGLVGPLASLDAGLGILPLLFSWFVVPIVAGLFSKFLFEKC